jgi:hypothetical protein
MEILSFGIDRAPFGAKKPEGYALDAPINLQSPEPSATTVNTFPRS